MFSVTHSFIGSFVEHLSLPLSLSLSLYLYLISLSLSSLPLYHLISLFKYFCSFLFVSSMFILVKKKLKKVLNLPIFFLFFCRGNGNKKCPSCFKKRKCEKKIGKNFVVLVPTISSLRFTFLLHQSIHPNLHYHLFITILNLPSHLSIVWAKLLH